MESPRRPAIGLGGAVSDALADSALARRFDAVAQRLDPGRLGGEEWDEGAVLAELGRADLGTPRLLDFYTRDGVEYALERYGILAHLRGLGYAGLCVACDPEPRGQRLRVTSREASREELLVECVVARQRTMAADVLYVHWLTLRHPRAGLGAGEALLPGQDCPGLGLVREAAELIREATLRLGLDGVRFCPATYHLAVWARELGVRFLAPERAGRFEAMTRDLGHLPLASVSRAVASGRVHLDGVPYRWEASPMGIARVPEAAGESDEERRERERAHFELH